MYLLLNGDARSVPEVVAHQTFRQQVSLENLNPNNVTKLNDVPLVDRCIVKDSDTFAIGDRTFRFEMAGGKVQCTGCVRQNAWRFESPMATVQKTPLRRASTKSVSSDVKMSGGSRPGDFTPKSTFVWQYTVWTPRPCSLLLLITCS